ncbi:MAG: PQQ-binding-like beta-propeller repeat protein [Planctomycetes bacterium]|nr:PQQ-binding-like beta-propeller repeat protein [Planctomycetota bacterium]
MKRTSLLWAFVASVGLGASSEKISSDAETAAMLISRSGLPGGMIVVIDGEDVNLTLALGRDERFVVQTLATDKDRVERARQAIQEAGCYGRVSAIRFDGLRLPYTDNLVNLVVVAEGSAVGRDNLALDELLRVLTPLGTAYIRIPTDDAGDTSAWNQQLAETLRGLGAAHVESMDLDTPWLKITKAWPKQIDEWTHFLHGPDGNPVAQDSIVGPPRHYQWIAGPTWAQSHESDTNLRCLVTGRGRLYFIVNETPTSLAGPESPPDKWFLQARDAFNGTLLWKRPIKDWGWRQWKPSWFTPRPGVIPLNLDKRLVAAGEKLYVTLGFRAPVSEVDGRTGEILRTFAGTERTSEILHLDDSLVLTVLQDDRAVIKRISLADGQIIWQSEKSYAGTTVDYYRFTARGGNVEPAKVDPTLDLAAHGNTVALIDGDSIVGLDLYTGRQRWRSAFPLVKADFNAGRINTQKKLWNGAMIVTDEVVVHASPNQLAAFSATTGQILWQQPKKYLQHLWYEWQDVFVIDGLVWTWSAELVKEKLEGGRGSSLWPVSIKGYDLRSGVVKREVSLGKIFKANHHHRCYRNKATVNYIITSRRGSEFIDLRGGAHTVNNWVRGACHMGMMPANGLQYAPPHPCKCYIDEKLSGFNALAPKRRVKGEDGRVKAKGNRLEKGIAYNAIHPSPVTLHTSSDWPTLRGDAARSGSVHTMLPEHMTLAWQVPVGTRVGAPISVGERAFVPLIDEHQIVALHVQDGRELWRFTAGARIDSPPTYERGALLFGSADGWVYCVRAADGQLIWRLRGGPQDRLIGVHGQFESAWPVHGSVLVERGVGYFAAGRSSHLDGGVHMVAVDTRSGRVLHEKTLSGPHYGVDDIQQNFQLPMGYLPDILYLEGDSLFMRASKFDRHFTPQTGEAQLKAVGGFLDDAYFKRMPWSMGKSGHARVLVCDDSKAYCLRMFDSLKGLDPKVYFTPGKKGYLLFASDLTSGRSTWSQRVPIRGRALVVTDNQLCVAGPPDTVNPNDPLGAFEGRLGAVLRRIRKTDGKTIGEHQLTAPPVFHGAAAANHRLFLTLEDGSVACFAETLK